MFNCTVYLRSCSVILAVSDILCDDFFEIIGDYWGILMRIFIEHFYSSIFCKDFL